MGKSLESAQNELAAVGLEFYATLQLYRNDLNIILKNMSEDETIRAMVYGFHKRTKYLICASDSQVICGSKPLIGKDKEMIFKMDELTSITMKSNFLLGHNVVLTLKDGTVLKFNSDEKKNVSKFVEAASGLVQ